MWTSNNGCHVFYMYSSSSNTSFFGTSCPRRRTTVRLFLTIGGGEDTWEYAGGVLNIAFDGVDVDDDDDVDNVDVIDDVETSSCIAPDRSHDSTTCWLAKLHASHIVVCCTSHEVLEDLFKLQC